MKRSKIKTKYLEQINSSLSKQKLEKNIFETNLSQKESPTSTIDDFSIFDKIEKKLFCCLIAFGIILLYIFKDIIPLLGITFLGESLETISITKKVLFFMIGDILILAFFIWFYRKDLFTNFKNFFGKNFGKNIGFSLLFWICGLILMMISNNIISIIRDGAIASNEEGVRSLIDIAPWYMAFETIIFAPVVEELVFRKNIQTVFHNKYLYVFVSGFVFGGMHVFFSMTSALDLLYLVPYCSLGFIFAALYQRTDNIFSTITVHSIHNTLAFLLYLVAI